MRNNDLCVFKKKQTENESAKNLKPKEIYSKLTAHKWFSMWQVLDGPSWCQAHTHVCTQTPHHYEQSSLIA